MWYIVRMNRTGYLATGAGLLAYGVCVSLGSMVGGLFAAAGAVMLVVGWGRKDASGERTAGFNREG